MDAALLEQPKSTESLCYHLRRMADHQGDQVDADRLSRAADILTAQAAEIARHQDQLGMVLDREAANIERADFRMMEVEAQRDAAEARVKVLEGALKNMLEGYQEWDMVGTTPTLRPDHLQTSWIQRAIAALKGGA